MNKNMAKRVGKRKKPLKRAFITGVTIGGAAVFIFFLTVALLNMDRLEEKTIIVHSYIEKEEETTEEPAYAIDDEFLILVNWDNPVPYERPDDLVPLYEIFGEEVNVVNSEGSINKTAGFAAKKMFTDAAAQGITDYKITGAYRSTIYQQQLWEEKLAEDPTYGKNPFIEPVNVMPGNMSEHSTGLAIDVLCDDHDSADEYYGETPHAKWLYQNAHKYGFILRYPEGKEYITGVIYEPWHFRYVGIDAAKEIYENGLCLEEYIELISDTVI